MNDQTTKGATGPNCLHKLVRPPSRIVRVRAGLYNYRGYILYRTKRDWVILGEDSEAYEYAPRRADLVRIIDRWERIPNNSGQTRGPTQPTKERENDE